jgi:hypothetical protein
MCYETDTESHEISITSFSLTCCTEQHWDCLPYCRTLQLCKYSSCYIRPQSSLYTHSSSYDVRHCGDSGYCILWWIEFGSLAANIIYWPTAHCGSLPTCCPWQLECLVFLCPFSVYMYIYIYINLYWDNLKYRERYLYNIICYHSAIQRTVNIPFCQKHLYL